jgi:LAO/AO transport system kinase
VTPDRVERIRAGDRATVARAISEIEHGRPSADALSAALAPHAGAAHVVGITGAPGPASRR